MSESEEVKHFGSCHCGAVKFEVFAPKSPIIIRCNCSICTKKQNHHFIVPKSKFRLIQGEDKLTTYTFNTHVAKHTFCSVCGVQSFYSPRSNPDGVGIMPHCIDGQTLGNGKEVEKSDFVLFDGKNWEREIEDKEFVKKMSKEK